MNLTIRKTVVITFLGISLIFCSTPKDKVKQFVLTEFNNYPEAGLSDIYKNLFKDSFGPGHLIPDTLEAGSYLNSELQDPFWVDTAKFQKLGINHDFVRVNLILVKNGLIPRTVLFDAMVKSVPLARKPGIEDWKKEWFEVERIVKEIRPDLPGFLQDSLKIDEMLATGETVMHHSEQFTEKYHPHYRIIHKSFFNSWENSYLKKLDNYDQ
jgi:hypothetical protein